MPASVVALRRYPVKSMGGEDLAAVDLDERGVVGDRWYAVVDGDGRLASAKDSSRFRRRDAVLGFRATTRSDGAVVVTSERGRWRVGDPALDTELGARTGAPQRVAAEAGTPHQDGGALSLVGTATLRWCEQRWGGPPDPRRLRVNVLVDTQEPFEEESWVGRELALGPVARLTVVERVPRCRTIDIAQDGVVPQARWLRGLAAERDLCLAVYADVLVPGRVSVGDRVAVP